MSVARRRVLATLALIGAAGGVIAYRSKVGPISRNVAGRVESGTPLASNGSQSSAGALARIDALTSLIDRKAALGDFVEQLVQIESDILRDPEVAERALLELLHDQKTSRLMRVLAGHVLIIMGSSKGRQELMAQIRVGQDPAAVFTALSLLSKRRLGDPTNARLYWMGFFAMPDLAEVSGRDLVAEHIEQTGESAKAVLRDGSFIFRKLQGRLDEDGFGLREALLSYIQIGIDNNSRGELIFLVRQRSNRELSDLTDAAFDAFQDSRADQLLKLRSVNAIGLCGCPRATTLLSELLMTEQDERVRVAAAHALGIACSPGKENETLGGLVRGMRPGGGDGNRSIAENISMLDTKEALEALSAIVLSSTDAGNRAIAAGALSYCSGRTSTLDARLRIAAEALADPDGQVRTSALTATYALLAGKGIALDPTLAAKLSQRIEPWAMQDADPQARDLATVLLSSLRK